MTKTDLKFRAAKVETWDDSSSDQSSGVRAKMKKQLLQAQNKDQRQQKRKRDEYDVDYDRGKVKKVRDTAGKATIQEMAVKSRDAFDGAYGPKKGVWKPKGGKDWRKKQPDSKFKAGGQKKSRKIY